MKIKRIAQEFAVLAAVAVISLVGMAANGCGSATHKASVAADSIGISLQTAATANHDLAAGGAITLAERQQVAGLIDKAAKANDTFVGKVKQLAAAGAPVTAADYLTEFNALVDAVNELETNGVLKISNPASQQRFEVIVQAIKAQVEIIRAVLGVPTAANEPGQPVSPGHGSPLVPLLAGGLLTPVLIEEGLALATQLIAKLAAIKAATDAQLQTDALATDAAAEKQAEADMGSN